MTCLRNSSLFALLFWLSTSCAIQNEKKFTIESFPSKYDHKAFQVVNLSAKNIQQKCIFLNAEAENNWRHLHFMYFINDKHEVFEVLYPQDLDKKSCENLTKKIEKIYKKSSDVKICLRGNLKTDTEYHRQIDFGKLGIHTTKYNDLFFETICNAKDCYSYDAYTNTCPGFQLPSQK